MKKSCLIFLLGLSINSSAVVVYDWDFRQGALQGWYGNASVSNLVAGPDGASFSASGTDPNFLGPILYDVTNLIHFKVIIRMRSNAADGNGKLFWGQVFTEVDSLPIEVVNDNQWHEYTLILPENLQWADRLRLDPCDGTGQITVAWIRVEANPGILELDNGQIIVKMNAINSGGAITYLSPSGQTRNLINNYDRGRQIQQSYYAGQAIDRRAQGQHPSWSPWRWNPIQVGDTYGHSSQVLEATVLNQVAYTKTIPLLWDMNNEPAEAIMEQWTQLEENRVKVRCRITCQRTDNLWDTVVANQEVPAVYTISSLHRLMTYVGNNPWQNAPLTQIVYIPNPSVPSFPWNAFGPGASAPYNYPGFTEQWAATVDDNDWGVGVFNRNALRFLGGRVGGTTGGEFSSSTSYIAPLSDVALKKDSVYEFEYVLIVGSLNEIRDYAYQHKPANIGRQIWKFNTDGDFEGWNPVQNFQNPRVGQGWLSATVNGIDPILVSPSIIVAASTHPFFHLRIRNRTQATVAQLFWANEYGTHGGDRFQNIPISSNDTDFQYYVVDLSSNPAWKGIITSLRLDPVSNRNGDIDIDLIALWDSRILRPDTNAGWMVE